MRKQGIDNKKPEVTAGAAGQILNPKIGGEPLIFFIFIYIYIKLQEGRRIKNVYARKRQNSLEHMHISDLFSYNYLKSHFNRQFTLDNKNNIMLVYISRRKY
jgi:hypothetical protein